MDRAYGRAAACAQGRHDELRALLGALADQLDSDRESLAGLISAEMVKLANEARAEVETCAWVYRYYAMRCDAQRANAR